MLLLPRGVVMRRGRVLRPRHQRSHLVLLRLPSLLLFPLLLPLWLPFDRRGKEDDRWVAMDVVVGAGVLVGGTIDCGHLELGKLLRSELRKRLVRLGEVLAVAAPLRVEFDEDKGAGGDARGEEGGVKAVHRRSVTVQTFNHRRRRRRHHCGCCHWRRADPTRRK